MALPLILAGVQTALSIGGAVASHVARDREADAAEQEARQALRLKRRDLSIRGIEETQSARQRLSLADRQARRGLGSTRASAAAAGVSGASVTDLEDEIHGDLGMLRDSIDFNLTASLDQIARMREGVEAEGQSRLNQVQAARPSLVETLLRVGGAGLDAYSFYRRTHGVPGSDAIDGEDQRLATKMEQSQAPLPTTMRIPNI